MKLTGDIWDWAGVRYVNLNLPCNNILMTGNVKSSGESRMVAQVGYTDNTSEQFNVNFSEGEITPIITINSEKIIQTLELQFTLKHNNGTMFNYERRKRNNISNIELNSYYNPRQNGNYIFNLKLNSTKSTLRNNIIGLNNDEIQEIKNNTNTNINNINNNIIINRNLNVLYNNDNNNYKE